MEVNLRTSLLNQGKSSRFIIIFFITLGLSKSLNIAFNKIFTNVLSKEEMGLYAIFLSAISLFASFSSFGFPSALNRYAIKFKVNNKIDELKDFVSTGFVSFISLEAFIIGLLLILYHIYSIKVWFLEVEHYTLFLFLIAVILPSQILSTICYTIASSLQNSRYYFLIVASRAIFQIAFGMVFTIFLPLGVFGLIAGLATAEFLVAAYSAYKILSDIGLGRFSKKHLKDIAYFSFPVYLTSQLMFLFDITIYLLPGDTSAVADFRYGAVTIVSLVLVTSGMFRFVFRPVMYKHFEKKEYEKINIITFEVFKLFVVFFVPLLLIIYGFSPFLVVFFTKSDYLSGLPAIPLLLASTFFIYLQSILAYGHALYLKNYWNAIAGITAFSIALTVGYFTIQYDTLIGMSLSYFMLRFFYFIGLFLASQKYIHLKLNKRFIMKAIIITAIAVTIGYLLDKLMLAALALQYRTIIAYGTSALIYLLLAYLLKMFSKYDFMFVKNIINEFLKTRVRSQ